MPSNGDGAVPPGPARPRDRRENHRAAIEIPAVLQVGGRRVNCTIRDLSSHGISLTVGESLAPGMVVRVAFHLPNARQPVAISGRLVRQSGGRAENTVGLELVGPDADTVRALETFVARNRTDRPFSRRTGEPETGQVQASDEAAALRGLYQRAVDDVVDRPGKRRGLLDRLLRRGR